LINIRTAAGAALASTLLLVLPASALAHGDDHGGPMGDRGDRRGDVPSRIANKLRSAERAMDRAQEHADDAEPDASVAALAAVRRHLAAATKSVGRRVSAGNPGGPAAAAALARTQGDIVEGTVGLFDGAPDAIVAADAQTLKAALDGRDALVAAIAALTDHGGYGWALRTIARDATGEVQDIAETLTDDTLTDAAKAALTAAQAQVTATAAAAQAAAGAPRAPGAGPPRAPGPGAPKPPGGTPGPNHGVADPGSDAGASRDCPPGQGLQRGDQGGGNPEGQVAPAA
jgi:hypothetical protein